MSGIYYIENSEEYGCGALMRKNTRLCFEMSESDWHIVEKSEKFQAFVDHIEYCTAYRDIPNKKYLYDVTEFTECEYFDSVKVSFSLACHDWLKLQESQVFLDLVSFLLEFETRDIRRENRLHQE